MERNCYNCRYYYPKKTCMIIDGFCFAGYGKPRDKYPEAGNYLWGSVGLATSQNNCTGFVKSKPIFFLVDKPIRDIMTENFKHGRKMEYANYDD